MPPAGMIGRMSQPTKPMKRATPKKKEPPKAPKKKGVLSPQQETFAVELAKGTSQAEAYRIAYPKSRNWTSKTVINRASELADHGGVLGRVEELRAISAQANEASVADVLKGYLNVLRADPRRLIAHHRGACRYCHGDDHRYQFTPGEFEQAQEKHARDLAEDPLIGEFDPKGGIGYDPRRPPHSECPDCFGEGKGRVIIGDTREFGPEELALYEGVKVTRVGMEVNMASRMDALAQVARHVGFFEKDNKLEISSFDAETLEAKFRDKMAAAMERQAQALAERRRLRSGD